MNLDTEPVWDLLKNELQMPPSGNRFIEWHRRGRIEALADVLALAYPPYQGITAETIIEFAKDELGITA